MRTSKRFPAALAATGLVVLSLAACSEDETPVAQSPAATTSSPGDLNENDLNGRIGDEVTLTGTVTRLIAPYALTMGGPAEFGRDPILVVARTLPDGIAPGDSVEVEGTVTTFEAPGYEADLDVDLVDDEFEDFDNDPAIQARSVTLS